MPTVTATLSADFGTTDKTGRKVGASVALIIQNDGALSFSGNATRNGAIYGTGSFKSFKTIAERNTAAIKYFNSAQKRAQAAA